MIKEEFNNKISFSEKIKQIKVDNPGKFDHLPDPIPVGVLSNWKEEDILEFESELKYKFEVESSKNTKGIQKV